MAIVESEPNLKGSNLQNLLTDTILKKLVASRAGVIKNEGNPHFSVAKGNLYYKTFTSHPSLRLWKVLLESPKKEQCRSHFFNGHPSYQCHTKLFEIQSDKFLDRFQSPTEFHTTSNHINFFPA